MQAAERGCQRTEATPPAADEAAALLREAAGLRRDAAALVRRAEEAEARAHTLAPGPSAASADAEAVAGRAAPARDGATPPEHGLGAGAVMGRASVFLDPAVCPWPPLLASRRPLPSPPFCPLHRLADFVLPSHTYIRGESEQDGDRE